MGWNARLILIAAAAASIPLVQHVADHFDRDETMIAQSRTARLRLLQEIRLRSALSGAPVTTSGWITEISDDWFATAPVPPWSTDEHRNWLEIAPPDQVWFRDPPNPVLRDENDAVWWFNPNLGILRARVPQQTDDVSTRDLYARVND